MPKKKLYVKKTISLPDDMYREALGRAQRLNYPSFSEYMQYLVRVDIAQKPAHTLIREEPAD